MINGGKVMKKQYNRPETTCVNIQTNTIICASGSKFGKGGGGDPLDAV